ncbi:hypothetical protein V2J09_023147 [Rumex salicifolius]
MDVLMEDDVFFADLNRQISLLIMDDDDDDQALHTPSVSLQAFPHQRISQHPIHPAFFHPEMLRREIKGTGVFIPRSSQPRRKNRQNGRQSTKSGGRQNKSGSRVTYNASNFTSDGLTDITSWVSVSEGRNEALILYMEMKRPSPIVILMALS